MNDYILEYYQKIEDGSLVTSKYIIEWYEYIIRGLENKSFYLDLKKANKAIKFVENFCHHHEGKLAPGLFKLELWEKALMSVMFGIVDSNGVRQFREFVIVMARKNGKTLLASAISCYIAYLDKDYGKRIYYVAPKLDQARICFNGFYQTMMMEEELYSISKKRRNDVYIESTDTTIMPVAFNAKKADGFNPSLVVCDEIASWHGDPGIKQYEVFTSALGSREQPIVLSISTAGYENEGIYDELMKRATSLLKGTSEEKRLAPFLYIVDDVEKWDDINELKKSNPNLNVSTTVDFLLDEIAIAEGSLSKKMEFITKYCNVKQNSSQAWLDAQTIEKSSGHALSLEDFRDCYCVGGIDLSRTTDLTAACVIIEKNGKLYTFAKFFLPKEKIDEAIARDGLPYRAYIQRDILVESGDNFVDYHDVFNWFRMLIEEYHIYPLQVGYDRYSAQYLVDDMKQYGFHMDDVFQGENLTPVIQEVEGIMKDGKVCIGNNDLLKAHFLDSAVKVNAETARRKLVKLRPMAHIDGMAAFLDAMCVRQKWYGEIGEQLRNS